MEDCRARNRQGVGIVVVAARIASMSQRGLIGRNGACPGGGPGGIKRFTCRIVQEPPDDRRSSDHPEVIQVSNGRYLLGGGIRWKNLVATFFEPIEGRRRKEVNVYAGV